MSECVFCAIRDGGIPADVVASTDTVLAFRDLEPQAPVHVVVIPRDHHESLAGMAAVDAQGVGDLMTVAGEVATAQGVAASGYRLVSNVGPDSGQLVAHVHVHVLGGRPLGPLTRAGQG